MLRSRARSPAHVEPAVDESDAEGRPLLSAGNGWEELDEAHSWAWPERALKVERGASAPGVGADPRLASQQVPIYPGNHLVRLDTLQEPH